MVVTTVQTVVLIGATLGGLALIGYPFKRLFELLRTPLCVPTIVFGLAVVEVVAWYWLETGHRGLALPVAALVAFGAVVVLVDMVRLWPRLLRMDSPGV